MKLRDNISFKLKWILLSIVAVLLIVAILCDYSVKKTSLNGIDVQHVTSVLREKENKAKEYINQLIDNVSTHKNYVIGDLDVYEKKLNSYGISILAYKNDTLVFWSTNSVEVPRLYRPLLYGNNFKRLHHGWFRILTKTADDYKIVALIVIKKEYQYQNSYLQNAFSKGFNLPKSVQITIDEDNGVKFYSSTSEYLFSLEQNTGIFQSVVNQSKASLFYALAFILGLICSIAFIIGIKNIHKARLFILAYGLMLLLMRFLMLKYSIPDVFHSMELFYPALYAASEYFPSLGDFLLNFLCLFSFVFILSKKIMLNRQKKTLVSFLVLIVLLFIVYGFFLFEFLWFKSLIIDSSMSFQIFNFSYITIYTFVGYFTMVLIFFTFLYFSRIIIKYSSKILSFKQYLLGIILFSPLCIFILCLYDKNIDYFIFIFPFYIFIFLSLLPYRIILSYRNAVYIIGLLLSTLLIVTGINKYSREKEIQDKKITALNLAVEYDQTSEKLLVSIDKEIKNDAYLKKQCDYLYLNNEWISEYIKDEYFQGFWNRFSIQITLCTQNEELRVDSQLDTQDCFEFFDEMKNSLGEEIPGTNFYLLNEFNGMISYLGIYEFLTKENKSLKLYIRVDSYPGDEGVGYPDLLLDENFDFSSLNKNFSYAKYSKGRLITSSGKFHYYLNEDRLLKSDSSFMHINTEGYNLFRYKFDNNSVYVASKEISLYDRLITVPYIFIMICICALILYCFEHFFHLRLSFSSFKYRIQFGMFGVLLLFFIMLAGGSVFYNIITFNQNNRNYLSGKLALVQRELFADLSSVEILRNTNKNRFNDILRQFSDIITVDIHIYNLDGGVISTSRNEIFDKKLQDHKMNYNAFYQLSKMERTHFIHKERIGEYVYLSAYDAIIDNENNVIGYVNLPYFVKKGLLEQDVFNLVMTGLNMYLLVMFITIFISLLIANTIIRPLQLLQSQFKKIRYGSTSEKLIYNKKDELGDLVLEYNKMLDELDRSAKLLAKSERESAWREMAKQIAHEIKNPLTPMKLNIQFLQKKLDDKVPDWEKYFSKMSANLIEQIDALSNIASAFSNFAQMPSSNNEIYNLTDILSQLLNLYQSQERGVKYIFNILCSHQTNVYIDKEQFNRVFINIINNAQQAIGDDANGEIIINIKSVNKFVLVEIIDNGAGMTLEVKEKLFMPNFTTKSSGMGLGLAISKQIVENAKGSIWVSSTLGKGSVFSIKIPKAEK